MKPCCHQPVDRRGHTPCRLGQMEDLDDLHRQRPMHLISRADWLVLRGLTINTMSEELQRRSNIVEQAVATVRTDPALRLFTASDIRRDWADFLEELSEARQGTVRRRGYGKPWRGLVAWEQQLWFGQAAAEADEPPSPTL